MILHQGLEALASCCDWFIGCISKRRNDREGALVSTVLEPKTLWLFPPFITRLGWSADLQLAAAPEFFRVMDCIFYGAICKAFAPGGDQNQGYQLQKALHSAPGRMTEVFDAPIPVRLPDRDPDLGCHLHF